MFNLFTPPCFAAMGAMNSEMQDKKWLLGGVALQFATGYTVAFFVYQIGTLITTGSFGTAFVPGLIAVAGIVAVIGYLVAQGNKRAAAEEAAKAAAKAARAAARAAAKEANKEA